MELAESVADNCGISAGSMTSCSAGSRDGSTGRKCGWPTQPSRTTKRVTTSRTISQLRSTGLTLMRREPLLFRALRIAAASFVARTSLAPSLSGARIVRR